MPSLCRRHNPCFLACSKLGHSLERVPNSSTPEDGAVAETERSQEVEERKGINRFYSKVRFTRVETVGGLVKNTSHIPSFFMFS